MHIKRNAELMLKSRTQFTRRAQPVARGYGPPPHLPLVDAAFRFRGALRARLRAIKANRYSEVDIYTAFLGGLLTAFCVFVPFLPRLSF
jgi:hypothetical protein